MLKRPLVAPVRPDAAAVSVYPVPVLLRLSPEKVATPPAAATDVAPDNVLPPGFVPIAMVTVPVNPLAVFPPASSALTVTAGEMNAPAFVPLGSTEKTRWVAEGGCVGPLSLEQPMSTRMPNTVVRPSFILPRYAYGFRG